MKERIHVGLVWLSSMVIIFLGVLIEVSYVTLTAVTCFVIIIGILQITVFKSFLLGTLSMFLGAAFGGLIVLNFNGLWYSNICILLSLYFLIVAAYKTRSFLFVHKKE